MGIFDNLFKTKPQQTDSQNSSQQPGMVEAKKELDMLIAQGKVEKIFLMPEVFGGTDVSQNILWVTIKCARAKEQIDQQVISEVQGGRQIKYNVFPHYDDSVKISYIPSNIEIIASDEVGFEIHKFIDCQL